MASSPRQHVVRVSERKHRALRDISAETGKSIGEVVNRAVDRVRRERMFAEAGRALREMEGDTDALAEIDAEHDLWDTTVGDGLRPERW